MQKVAFLVSFGLGGHSVEAGRIENGEVRSTSHISGYDSPETFSRALKRERTSLYPPLAHVPVLDKREVLKESPGLSLQSPLVSATLSPGEIDRFDKAAARNMLPGLEGAFQTLAQHALETEETPEAGPLDSVSVPDYVAWWTKRGARLGHMDETGTQIIWDESGDSP